MKLNPHSYSLDFLIPRIYWIAGIEITEIIEIIEIMKIREIGGIGGIGGMARTVASRKRNNTVLLY